MYIKFDLIYLYLCSKIPVFRLLKIFPQKIIQMKRGSRPFVTSVKYLVDCNPAAAKYKHHQTALGDL